MLFGYDLGSSWAAVKLVRLSGWRRAAHLHF
jgi:hypothetical protein